MKKLSIIMAFALVLTTFCAMFVTTATAAEDVIVSLGERNNNSYILYNFSSDKDAIEGEDVTGDGIADFAIGRYGEEGEGGYALTWEVARGNMGDCHKNGVALKEFTVLNNPDGTERTIDFSTLNVDWGAARSTGGVIDGGGMTVEVTNHQRINEMAKNAIENEAPFTFKNINFVYTAADSALQVNANNDINFGEGCTLTVANGVTTTYGLIIQNNASVHVNGATMTFNGSDSGDFRLNEANAKLIIKSGNITGKRVVYTCADDCSATITGGTIASDGQNLVAVKSGNRANITITGGTFNYSTWQGAIFFEAGADHNLVVNGGTFNGQNTADCFEVHNATNVTMLIKDGTYNGAGKIIDFNASGTIKSIDIYGGNWESTASEGLNLIKQVGSVNIYGGNFTAKKEALRFSSLAGTLNCNIYDGTFTTTNSGNRVIYVSEAGGAKTINVYGGTFIGNNTTVISDTSVPPKGTNVTIGNAYVSGGTLNVYGGKFYMSGTDSYSGQAGNHLTGWAAGVVNVYGGAFYGGTNAYVRVDAYDYDEATEGDQYGARVNYDSSVAIDSDYELILTPETENGASIRTALGSMGIRFTSTIGKEMVDWAVAKAGGADKVTYGTLIVPADYLTKTNGVFTLAALQAADLGYADIVAKDGLIPDGNGGYKIRAALINIQEANKQRDFVAVAYVNINGTYIYANDQSANRSIDYVAKAALAHTEATSSSEFNNAVTSYYTKSENADANGKYTFTYVPNGVTRYSKYSDAQLTVIRYCVAE